MAKTIVAVFSNQADVENAIEQLENLKYDPKQMSLLMKDGHTAEEIHKDVGVDVAEGATTGAVTGGAIGGLTGLLVGLGLIAIPGGLLIGGPLAAALGLTGAAATTASGVATGALAGGIVGALASLGIPKEEAVRYEEEIQAGGILLAVPVMNERTDEVRDIMNKAHAKDVRQLDLTDTH